MVESCITAAKGRVPVIAGAGSNSTKEAVELSRHAEKAGATAVLIVTPYYNKPTQEGLYQHFKAINDAIRIPIIMYNIPSRCVIDMSVATMARLFQLENIIGVKDATASPDKNGVPNFNGIRSNILKGGAIPAVSRSRRPIHERSQIAFRAPYSEIFERVASSIHHRDNDCGKCCAKGKGRGHRNERHRVDTHATGSKVADNGKAECEDHGNCTRLPGRIGIVGLLAAEAASPAARAASDKTIRALRNTRSFIIPQPNAHG